MPASAEQPRVEATGELVEGGRRRGRRLPAGPAAASRRAAGRVPRASRTSRRLHREGDQVLLGAVVDVALQPGAGRVGRRDDPLAGLAQLLGPGRAQLDPAAQPGREGDLAQGQPGLTEQVVAKLAFHRPQRPAVAHHPAQQLTRVPDVVHLRGGRRPVDGIGVGRVGRQQLVADQPHLHAPGPGAVGEQPGHARADLFGGDRTGHRGAERGEPVEGRDDERPAQDPTHGLQRHRDDARRHHGERQAGRVRPQERTAAEHHQDVDGGDVRPGCRRHEGSAQETGHRASLVGRHPAAQGHDRTRRGCWHTPGVSGRRGTSEPPIPGG